MLDDKAHTAFVKNNASKASMVKDLERSVNNLAYSNTVITIFVFNLRLKDTEDGIFNGEQ